MDALWFDDHFPQNALDAEWLPTAGANGWLVLTADKEIRHNFPEIDAVMVHRIGCFLLPKDLRAEELAALVARVQRRIENISRSRGRPFIYGVYKDGRVERRDSARWLQAGRDERASRGLPPI